MDTPHIKPGEQNDPSVEIGNGSGAACTPQFRETMLLLGFKESDGSFVYSAKGRGIWVNPSSPELNASVMEQIVAQAEAIGRRAKINEIRKALDLPFGEVEVIKPAHAH